MQLGVRWRAGDPPHHSVPEGLYAAITTQEIAHPAAVAWTLTWLEGRPRCALDDLALLTLEADGQAVLVAEFTKQSDESRLPESDEDDDDWLK